MEQQNFNKDTQRQIVEIIKKLQKAAKQRLHALRCPACNERLPQRPTTVWVRTFDIEHPPKKPYWRELLESEGDEQEEAVEEIETEEVNDDVEEYDE